MRRLLSILMLVLVLGSVAVAPFLEAGNSKFEKLRDVQVIGDASKKLENTLAKNFLQVEEGYGNTVNATILIKDGKLTILLQDDVNHNGRWFRISKKVLDKFDINIDSNIVTVYVDGKKTQSQKVEADNDKWIYFYVEHFSTRVITFEASIGYVEYENSVLMNYIEVPDDTGLYVLSFDGDDYVMINSSSSLDSITTELTIVAVVQDYNTTDGGNIIARNSISPANNGWRARIDATKPWFLVSNGSTYNILLGNTQIAERRVYMLAFSVKANGYMKIYVNGQLDASAPYPLDAIGGRGKPVYLGAWSPVYECFKGVIYLVLVYNRQLSDEEIQQIYNDPMNPPTDGLVIWFAPDSVDTVNNKWLDKSGNGNDGTIYGATLVPIAKPIISNITFDGQNFNITVTTEPASSFVDHVIVPKDLTPPSNINLIAFFYNNELYITGKSDQFPVMANIQHLPKGIYYASNGEIIHQQISTTETVLIVGNITSPSGVVKKYNDFTVSPTSNYVNITVLSKSKTLISLNASAPANTSVDFVWWPSFSTLFRPVQFIVDGKIIQEKTFKNNVVNFTYSGWSDHIIMMQPKPYTEVSNQYATLAISGLIGIVILGIALEQTKVENEWVRAGLIGLTVALFVMLVLTLL